ncbi:MAG: tetratricopeptide repeat protein [Pirellulales bacterium]|nr:tetratricopeptide repeat protein [Pirellulales bacterium]
MPACDVRRRRRPRDHVSGRILVPAAVFVLGVGCHCWLVQQCKAEPTGNTAGQASNGARTESLGTDDVPEPLVPRRKPTEAEEDRAHALALFSTARALEQRDKPAEALRLYQRALRYDPRSKAAARSVVILADQLGRLDQRDRYLPRAIALESEAVDPIDLVGLVDRTTDEPLRRRAIALLEKIAAARAGKKDKTPSDVALAWTLSETYLAADAFDKAADQVEIVIDAAEHPERFGLKDVEAKEWFGATEYRVFGQYMLRAKRFDRAEALFDEAQRLAPNAVARQYDLARVALGRGKPDDALARLDACLAGGSAELGLAPYDLLAEALEAAGKKDELIPRVAKLVEVSPDNLPAALFLAQTYQKTGEIDKALALFESLVARRPVGEGYRALFAIHRDKEQTDKLAALAGDLVEKVGSVEPIEEEIASLDEPAAEAFFKKALADFPAARPELALLWGQRHMEADEYAKAADAFRLGRDAKKATDEDRAIASYYLAAALAMTDKTDEALAAAREAGKDAKRLPLALAQQAWILFHANRDDEAVLAYDDLIAKYDADHANPGLREVLREARLVLAGLHVAQGDSAKARERLEQVLDEFPDDVSALNDLGYLWADDNAHLERALAMVQKAVEAEPDVAAYRDSLGWALFRLGRLDEALAELERAAAADPTEGELLEHLGVVYDALKRPADAEATWRRAIDAYRKADQPDRADALEKKLPPPDKPAKSDSPLPPTEGGATKDSPLPPAGEGAGVRENFNHGSSKFAFTSHPERSEGSRWPGRFFAPLGMTMSGFGKTWNY